MRINRLFAVVFLSALLCGAGAAQQAAPAQAAKPRAKKVWTEDDLIKLRTDFDLHRIAEEKRIDEERARAAAEAAKKAEEEKAGAETGAPAEPAAKEEVPRIPDTVPELQKRYDELLAKIQELEGQLRNMEDDALNLPEEERAHALDRKGEVEKELERTRDEFYLVRDRLQELRGNALSPPRKP